MKMSTSYITEDNNIATTVPSPQPQTASTGSMINVTLSILWGPGWLNELGRWI